MSDNSKLIGANGKFYHQLGLEKLIPNDGQVYGLRRGAHTKTAVPERIVVGDNEMLLTNYYTKQESDDKYITKDDLDTVENETHYGIRGDYCTHYGITKAAYGLATSPVGTADVHIKGGMVLCIPGKATLTTIGSDIIYTVESTKDVTLFFADGEIKEANDTYWQEPEPATVPGNSSAWWNPKEETWKFKAVGGGAWAESLATPIVDVKMSNETIIRLDHIGYRILNTDIIATSDDIDAIQEQIMHNTDEITENAENIGTVSNRVGNLERQLSELIAKLAENGITV